MTKLLRDLPVGALVRDKNSKINNVNHFTKHNGEPIIWRIVGKNYELFPRNSVTLATERIITERPFNESQNFLDNEFFNWLSNDFKNDILHTTTNVARYYVNLNSKIFIPSMREVGRGIEKGLEYFKDDNSRKAQNLDDNYDYWFTRDKSEDNRYPNHMQLMDYHGRRGYGYDAGVRPFCNARETIKVSDVPDSNGIYDMIWNQPPSKPSSFSLPEKAISRSETEISWTKSTDPENDPISYKLERSFDGGAFVERYKGSFTRFKDTIEDKGHKAVVYRVTAIDSNGNKSPSLTSASIPVSDNTIPTIETASADLGKITAAYSVSYKVVDPDSGQTWTVTEKLDGKVLKTFTAKVGTSYTSKLSASDWQKVLNGKHVLKIEVVDSDGGKSGKEISFEKAITKLDFMLDKTGVQGIDKMPERAILSMGASIPSGASIKIEITNNGLDDKPVWQDCTAQVLGNEKIFFSNKTKTATKWAVNVRVTGDKKTATDVLSVSIIGGFYD